eukprot:TRINITY_DN2540_c0_g1_i1.p1 TRINITY_DN2540_c0_g1~~TRINITY_DN2540_c0_g1_i1.p1  ORF type:complete len:657 (+),score=125.45 TRINITY_DN2540_c0_g1_i1:44-2014(+)
MKHTLSVIVVVLILTCFSIGCLSIEYQWKGSVSSAFGDPNNWSPVGVPTSSDSLSINYCTGVCRINLNQEAYTVVNMAVSTLIIENGTLTVTNITYLEGLNTNLLTLTTNNVETNNIEQGVMNKTNWFMTGYTNFNSYVSIVFQSPSKVYNQGTMFIGSQFYFTSSDNGTTLFNSGIFIYNTYISNNLVISFVNTGVIQVLQGTLIIGPRYTSSLLYSSKWDGHLYVAPGASLSFTPPFNALFYTSLTADFQGTVYFYGNDYYDGWSIANFYGTLNFGNVQFWDHVIVNVYGNVNVQSLTWSGGQLFTHTGVFTVSSATTYDNGFVYPDLLGNITLLNNPAANYEFHIGQNAILTMDGNWLFEQLSLKSVDDSEWGVRNIGTQTELRPLSITYNYINNGFLIFPQEICSPSSTFTFLVSVVQAGTIRTVHCDGKASDLIFAGTTNVLNGASFAGEGVVENKGTFIATGLFHPPPFKKHVSSLLNSKLAIVSSTAFEKDAVLVNAQNGTLQIIGNDFSAALNNEGAIQLPSITHLRFHSSAVFAKTGIVHLKVHGKGSDKKFKVIENDMLDFSPSESAQFSGTIIVDFTIESTDIDNDVNELNGVVIELAKWPSNSKFSGRFDAVKTTGLSRSIGIKVNYQTDPFTGDKTLILQLTF